MARDDTDGLDASCIDASTRFFSTVIVRTYGDNDGDAAIPSVTGRRCANGY